MATVPTVTLTIGRIVRRLRAKMIWPLAPPLSTSILKDTALIVQLTLEATETKHPV